MFLCAAALEYFDNYLIAANITKNLFVPALSYPNLHHRQTFWQNFSPYSFNLFSNFCSYSKRKGGQVRFTAKQTEVLEQRFVLHKYLSPEDRKLLADSLKLTDRQVMWQFVPIKSDYFVFLMVVLSPQLKVVWFVIKKMFFFLLNCSLLTRKTIQRPKSSFWTNCGLRIWFLWYAACLTLKPV